MGTSGWHYSHWEGLFYPPGLPKERWLGFYARSFPTVEVNFSFYRLPTEEAFEGWRRGSPPGFLFALKASRFITHLKRLRGAEEALARFVERARRLKGKLGPVLFQLPPGMKRDEGRLDGFLAVIPSGVQAALEFRHDSWFHPGVLGILRRHNAALCIVDMADFQSPVEVTADFAYVRFHGSLGLYYGLYGEEGLRPWARRLRRLARGLQQVYVYFNNDAEAAAVEDARLLRRLLQEPADPLD